MAVEALAERVPVCIHAVKPAFPSAVAGISPKLSGARDG
jgi:hypothetical protein